MAESKDELTEDVVEYIKNFEDWHTIKKTIDGSSDEPLFFKEGQIWWVSIGHNVHVEVDGKHADFSRPVLVLRKFSPYFFFGVPLSSAEKEEEYYYHHFSYKEGVISVALLSQLRGYSSKRLIWKDGGVKKEDFTAIQEKLVDIIKKPPVK